MSLSSAGGVEDAKVICFPVAAGTSWLGPLGLLDKSEPVKHMRNAMKSATAWLLPPSSGNPSDKNRVSVSTVPSCMKPNPARLFVLKPSMPSFSATLRS